jgi:Protein of unknown function (DUF1573)
MFKFIFIKRRITFLILIFLGFLIPNAIFAQKKPSKLISKNKLIKNMSSIQFDTLNYDFGILTEGDTIFRKFNFKNISNKRFDFSKVETSCNCTTVNYPFNTIMPQQSGIIEVRYISTNKMGNQKSLIKVKINTDPQMYTLSLSGIVWQKTKHE